MPTTPPLPNHYTAKGQKNLEPRAGGRNGFASYNGLPTTIITDNIKPGSLCPECQIYGQSGKLYNFEPGLVVSLAGHPIIAGDRYQILKLRCNLCSKIFIPEAAKEILELSKYAPSCGAVIALHKYYLGSAFYRMERYQEMLGIPLPSSTQWDLSNALGLNSSPIFNILETYTAEADKFKFDDSSHKIMDLPNSKQW